MRVLFDIGHPADVHFFKHIIFRLRDTGHQILVLARDKDVTIELLNGYQIPFINKGIGGEAIFDRVDYTLKSLIMLMEQFNLFKPDLCLSHASPYLAVAAKVKGIPHMMFNDTEQAAFFKTIVSLCRPQIYSPESFYLKIHPNQKLIPSFKELAYLHPENFKPDESIKSLTGNNYVLLRFVANRATHDSGDPGITNKQKLKIVDTIKKHCRVWISSESELPPNLEKYRLQVSPHRIHDVVYYSKLIIGGSGTMSAEAAMLGVPAIFISQSRLGYIDELANKYGLVHPYCSNSSGIDQSIHKAISIIENTNSRKEYCENKNKMLSEKKNMNQLFIDLIEKELAIL